MREGTWIGRRMLAALMIGLALIPMNSIAASTDAPAKAAEKAKPKTYEERDKEFKTKSVDELVSMLQKNPGNFHVIHRLRKLKDAKASAALADAFQQVKDRRQKQAAAAALVALGTKDDSYWTFLEGAAKKTVDDDMPFPISGNQKSPEFLAWCSKHGIEPDKAATNTMTVQADILFLGMTEDKRAIPILLNALKAKNPMVVDAAAMGLARVGYKPAIPQIVAAAKRETPDMTQHTARYLLLFNDATAQSAADELISDKKGIAFVRAMPDEKQREFILGE